MKELLSLFFILIVKLSFSQSTDIIDLLQHQTSEDYNVSFLDINMNTRVRGFGEVGVVSSPFYKSTGVYQNPALISINSRSAGLNYYYMPWLTNVINGINFSGVNGFYAIDSSNAVALNYNYFDLGEVSSTDLTGIRSYTDKLKEYFIKIAYSHSFSKAFSVGIAFKYFKSDIVPSTNEEAEPINSIAFDFGCSYNKSYSLHNNSLLNVAAGMDITNFGPKVTYVENIEKSFLPTKLALGLFINPDINIANVCRLNIELGYQAEKYLVPTSPVYNEEGEITDGYDPNISPFKALYQSFYDAPNGFDEEINEIRHKFGNEIRFSFKDYAYVAFRHGRNIEHETKGNRNYQTWGYGLGIFGFTFDYMIIKAENNSPLNNTTALSLGYVVNLDKEFFRF